MVPARISACLADISAWMSTHHLKLNLGKTELLFLPAKGSPMIDASITVEGSIVSPSQSARSLGVTLDNQLCFSCHIAAITRTCRFSLHNIRRIRPFLTQEATQLLVQALVISRLDYCNSLLAGLPACAIKPLQLVQNAAARLVFNQPKFTHVTPLLFSLHWLPIAARIRFKSLVLAFQVARGTAPPYLQSLITPYTPPRPLRSASSGKLTVPSLRAPGSRSSRSRLFSVLIPCWWKDLPQSVSTAESLPQETQNRPLQTPLPLNSVHLAKLSSPLFTCSTLYSILYTQKNRTFSFPVLQVWYADACNVYCCITALISCANYDCSYHVLMHIL
ncbi:hypothetical protein AAFF_G00177440 [Aldrovandia affinis]|uniref:Reverse transcriptase n=1 Tax=Aldrovandia affinis TaxID=143900 RepID=A0AAD7W7B0_9TELE|nr:hypothetical protein AAFF_G00177440 [Aldrovandia affinis]